MSLLEASASATPAVSLGMQSTVLSTMPWITPGVGVPSKWLE